MINKYLGNKIFKISLYNSLQLFITLSNSWNLEIREHELNYVLLFVRRSLKCIFIRILLES